MPEFELIGVPFDGYGRPSRQAAAAQELRDAGLLEVISSLAVHQGDLELPPPGGGRGLDTGLINEPALLAMTEQLHTRVGSALALSRFPIVVGGDCSSLLGIVSGARSTDPGIGVVFVDGHEDTMPLDVSEDGEAANCAIGLLLGLTGRLMRGPLAERLPRLDRGDLAMLGQRDGAWRRQFNVGSLRDYGVWLRSEVEVAADPVSAGRQAVGHVQLSSDRWWLHVDLDVLDPTVFPAQGLPDVADEPGGLGWQQLSEVLVACAGEGGCIGISIAIYDPDQDENGAGARAIVQLLDDVLGAVSRHASGDARTG